MRVPQQTSPSAVSAAPRFGELLSDAVRYWEPRRIGYNGILALVVLGWVVFTWPHFRSALTWNSLLVLCVLAVLANICYCAAYLVDVPAQYTSYAQFWRGRRWVLWLAGVLFAALIACYWVADEIYPAVAQTAAH
jgi:cobalamin synthase